MENQFLNLMQNHGVPTVIILSGYIIGIVLLITAKHPDKQFLYLFISAAIPIGVGIYFYHHPELMGKDQIFPFVSGMGVMALSVIPLFVFCRKKQTREEYNREFKYKQEKIFKKKDHAEP